MNCGQQEKTGAVVGSTPVAKEVARIVVFGVISYSSMPEFPLVD